MDSITSTIPSGTSYHFNPYAGQGNLPWIIVPGAGAVSPTPKVSPLPISDDSSDDGGLTCAADFSLENGSTGSCSGVSTRSHASPLLQPLQHIVPQQNSVEQQQHNFQVSRQSGGGVLQFPIRGATVFAAPTTFQQQQVHNRPHQPQHYPSVTTPRPQIPLSNGAVHGNVHGVLCQSSLKYMSYADMKSQPPSQPMHGVPLVKLFVGQVLHELRPTELSTLFSVLTGTSSAKVTPHGPGCFFVELPAAQFRSARQLNGRVLFDVHGVWFAESTEETKTLQEYMSQVKQELKTMRLPRSTLVVRR